MQPTEFDVGSFENTYIADDALAEITLTKVFENTSDDTEDARKLKANEFSFRLIQTDEDGKEKSDAKPIIVKNNEDGSIRFALSFKDPGQGIEKKSYYYKITEDKGTDTHIKYDNTAIRIQVDLIRNTDDGTLSAKVLYLTKDGNGKEVKSFINTYTASPCIIRMSASKTFIGKKLAGDDFSFTLTGNDVSQTKKNDKNGKITFDDFQIKKAGTYTYTVKEAKPADPDKHVKYDETVKTIKIKVVDKNGTLTATKA